MRTASLALLVAIAACGKSDPTPKPSATPAQKQPAATPRTPPPDAAPAAAAVPMEAWVRTTGYDGKPFLGFTYLDPVKGPCIKGEFTDGLSDEELSKRLQDFPSTSFEPYPEGNPATPLTAEEIARLKLPNPPSWVASFR